MARRFPGGTATDRVVTDFNAYDTTDHLYSYSVWVVREGTDDFRRIIDKEQVIQFWIANDVVVTGGGNGDVVQFQHQWSTEGGKWRFENSIIEDGAWHHLGVTYDGTSTANDPVMYADGASQTVVNDPVGDGVPSGSIVESGTEGVWIGNRSSDIARCYEGNIAHLAIWHGVILTAGEMGALASGVSPLIIRPDNLVSYVPLYGATVEPDLAPNPSGGVTVTGTTVPNDSAPVGRLIPRRQFAAVTVTGATFPAAPTGFTATAVSASQIDLSWDAVAGATGYDVRRGGVVIATDVGVNTFTDSSPDGSTLYEVRAVDG